MDHVVIGTAGHIDHGKTALVKALTGVDTDRLVEEKVRGITIDIGFAPLDLDGLPASVVDVPGHEAFIRNMLAGATGIDAALLVIAADEGMMPQTREHLLILQYLGVERGVVALTKCDIAEAEWRGLVAEDYRQSTIAQGQSPWPVVEVSAKTGQGLPALRAALREAALGTRGRSHEGAFRMPVDRVFTLAGAGTVVTGTSWSGTIRSGDMVTLHPGGAELRVRSIEVHGTNVTEAPAGRRAALALVGGERERIMRGHVVVTGQAWRASSAADVMASFTGATPRLRSRIHVHHGTSEVVARVARIGDAAPAGVPMRLLFDTPLVLRAGDRLVMRSWSPVTTIGGAEVLDPWADQLDRAQRKTIAHGPLTAARFVARRGRRGLTRAELEIVTGTSDVTDLATEGDWLVALPEVESAARRLEDVLDRYHAAHPLAPGMPAQEWRAAADGPDALGFLAEKRLLTSRAVLREGTSVRRPAFTAAASNAARSVMEQILNAIIAADAEPPSAAELAASLAGINVPGILQLLVREGRVVQVADRYYSAESLAREQARLEEALRALGPATPAAIRERLGRSRKWLIPLLEWADRQGVTVRDGDRRRLNLQAGA